MPGPSYTREFTYNEEAQLLGISHSGTLAYQYAYGADGNRRWSKDIANNQWTWYPCGVAYGAGEMVEETSDLTGSSWATSGQYLRAGGGCSSLLIRRKSTTDDEFHHEDMVGVFGVLTNATCTIIQNNVSDAYSVPQYVDQNGQILTKQIAVCTVTIAEPDMQAAPSGGAVSFQARALHVASKKSTPHHPCKKKKGPHDEAQCNMIYDNCMHSGLDFMCSKLSEFISGGVGLGVCKIVCSGKIFTKYVCAVCLVGLVGIGLYAYYKCMATINKRNGNCELHRQYCWQTGWWNFHHGKGGPTPY